MDTPSKSSDAAFSYETFEKHLESISVPSPQAEVSETTKELAAVIRSGHKGAHYRELCAKGENFCQILDSYFTFRIQAQNQTRESRRLNRQLRLPFYLQPKQVAAAQKKDSVDRYLRGLKISNEKNFLELANSAIEPGAQCPQNLSIALSLRADEFFPSEEVQKNSVALFQQGEACLNPEEKTYAIHYEFPISNLENISQI